MEIKTQEQQVLLNFKLCGNSLNCFTLSFSSRISLWVTCSTMEFPVLCGLPAMTSCKMASPKYTLAKKEGTIINLGFETTSGVQLLLQWFYIPQVSSPGTLTSPTL